MKTRAWMLILVLAAGCSRAPAAPDAAASFAGQWGGYFRLESWDPPHTAYQAGTRDAIIIDVDSSGLSATVKSEGAGSDAPRAFAGEMQSDGSIIFTRVNAPEGATGVIRVVLRRLAPGRLTGEMTYLADILPTRTFQTTIDLLTRVTVAPASTSFPLVGSWESQGQHATYTLCAGAPALCAGRFGFPRAAAYTLRVDRAGSGYEAQLVVTHENGTHRFRTMGTASGDGIRFNPVTMPADPEGTAQLLSTFELRPNGSGGLAGVVEYTTTGPAGSATRRIEILDGVRGDTVRRPGVFQGQWTGRYFARSCSGDCVGRMSGFVSFSLSQQGADIVGGSSLIPVVRGTASGNSATLSGDDTRACGLGGIATCTRRLSNVSVTVDALGLMQGTFTLDAHDGFQQTQFTVQGELFDVVRLPALIR